MHVLILAACRHTQNYLNLEHTTVLQKNIILFTGIGGTINGEHMNKITYNYEFNTFIPFHILM